MTHVAAIIIGDEILSGKIRDENTPLLIALCAERGASLKRVAVIGDSPEDIAEEVRLCSDRYDLVITSGGVGPTHDDRTVEGVALAFGVETEQSDEVEKMIRAFWGRRFTEAALRMARMPVGGRLLFGADGLLPLVQFRNVILFPGVPELFAAKLPSIHSQISGAPVHSVNLYLNSDESSVAPMLDAVDAAHPEVTIGSYPRFARSADHRLWIVLEAADIAHARAAADELLQEIDPNEVVRVE